MILSTISLVLFAAQARVDLLDGSKVFGNISSIDLNSVVLVDGEDNETTLTTDNVLDVTPATNAVFRQAEIAASNLDFMNASNAFAEVASKSEDPALQSFAELRSAEVLIAWAKTDNSQYSAAITLLNTWTSDNSESFWLPRAQMALAQALANTGDIDGATSLMSALSDMAFEKNLARHIELQANIIRCEAFLIGQQAQVAQSRLKSLNDKIGSMIRDSETPVALMTTARGLYSKVQILSGQAIQATDGISAAQSYWQALADDSATSPVVRSAAWLGLAEAAIESGELRSAQLQLAKIVATMPSSPDVTPQALYQLASVSNSLLDTKASRSAANRLSTYYPNSSWAIKATSQGL
ncbi:MAG: outer membrane protein assembly factor BamD (BamD/ComL family) [Myxococcota bacterium]|jgi:outer membrane protein assembly factor BamD (BamD/ComL family)